MTQTRTPARQSQRRTSILLPAILGIVGLLGLAIGAWFLLSAPGRHDQRINEALTGDVPVYGYEVTATHPHDTGHFTEGLVLEAGVLYEGTGRYGQSVLEARDFPAGEVLRTVDLDPALFGEGVTTLGDSIYQLTYRAGTGLIYDKGTLERTGSFEYEGEGWGLTHNGSELIMSNGSATLSFLDPETFEVVRQVTVHDDQGEVGQLNELEYVDGRLYANVFTQDVIAEIDPASGAVTAWLDLSGLHPDQADHESVLNGIAALPDDRLLVTGKNWDRMYEIELTQP